MSQYFKFSFSNLSEKLFFWISCPAWNRTREQKDLRDRNSPICTLSQNGYGNEVSWHRQLEFCQRFVFEGEGEDGKGGKVWMGGVGTHQLHA